MTGTDGQWAHNSNMDMLKFHFIFLFIFLIYSKASEALFIEQLSSNYPDLLPEMPSYCCPVEIFYFGLLVL